MNPDAYYGRPEVSNSDLTKLKELLHPGLVFPGREAAFRFGTLVDAIITEPERVNLYRNTVDDVQYDAAEVKHALEMRNSLRDAARKDKFLNRVLAEASNQKVSIRHGQQFDYCGFPFQLDTRCKWDWYLEKFNFGGDLKTVSARSQKEFDEAIDHFDWDRSRAWYMDIVGAERDFIYAISKQTGEVFKAFIQRGDAIYNRGREKYEELAFQWWCLNLN